MSTKSRLAAARAREMSQARFSELTDRFGAEAGKPTSQRELDPYPSKWIPRLRYAKDRWGVTDCFSSNRHEARTNHG